MLKDKRKEAEKQENSKALEEKLVKILWPVLVELKQKDYVRCAPTLAHMGWWTTRGEQASQLRTEEQTVLAHIGKEVLQCDQLHVAVYKACDGLAHA